MAKRIHAVPACPNCGKRQSRVILTCEAIHGNFDIVRRRHCRNCDHRWYTGQVNEVPLDGVEWTDHGNVINMTWSRQDSTSQAT